VLQQSALRIHILRDPQSSDKHLNHYAGLYNNEHQQKPEIKAPPT